MKQFVAPYTGRFKTFVADSVRAIPKPAILLCGVLALIGLVLRVWGGKVGLPFPFHDAENALVSRAVKMPLEGPNPHWFRYPTLYFYIQAGLYLIHYGVLWLVGAVGTYRDYYERFLDDPTSVYLLGRALNVAIAAITPIVAALSVRFFRKDLPAFELGAAAVCATAFVAFDVAHVERSHFITTDIPLALTAAVLLVLSGAMASRDDGGSIRQYVVSGALVGLSASFKYPGALLGVLTASVYVFTALESRRNLFRFDMRLTAAALTSVAFFLLGSPYVLLSSSEFRRDFGAEMLHMETGHLGFEDVRWGWLRYIQDLAAQGDIALVLFFLVGAAVLLRRSAFGRAVVTTVIVFFAVAGLSKAPFLRYLFPLLPLAATVAAFGLVASATGVSRLARAPRLLVAAVAILLCCSLALPALINYEKLRVYAGDSTRVASWNWAENRGEGAQARPRFSVERKSIPASRQRSFDTIALDYDFERLHRLGVQYVALSSNMYGRYLRFPERYGRENEFYKRLAAEGQIVAQFTPFADKSDQLTLQPGEAPKVTTKRKQKSLLQTLRNRRMEGPVIVIFEIPTDPNAVVARPDLFEAEGNEPDTTEDPDDSE